MVVLMRDKNQVLWQKLFCGCSWNPHICRKSISLKCFQNSEILLWFKKIFRRLKLATDLVLGVDFFGKAVEMPIYSELLVYNANNVLWHTWESVGFSLPGHSWRCDMDLRPVVLLMWQTHFKNLHVSSLKIISVVLEVVWWQKMSFIRKTCLNALKNNLMLCRKLCTFELLGHC